MAQAPTQSTRQLTSDGDAWHCSECSWILPQSKFASINTRFSAEQISEILFSVHVCATNQTVAAADEG
jgi:hypothetical protein